MRRWRFGVVSALALVVSVVACGGGQSAPTVEPAPESVDEPVVEAPPPEPRPLAPRVTHEQLNQFVAVTVEVPAFRPLDASKIVPRLPAELRSSYRTVLSDFEKLRPLLVAARRSGYGEEGGGRVEREVSYRACSEASTRHFETISAFGDLLEEAPSPVVGFGLALLRDVGYRRHLACMDNDGATADFRLGRRGAPDGARLSSELSSAREAAEHTAAAPADHAVAQYLVLQHAWSARQDDIALEALEEILEPEARRAVEAYLVDSDGFESELRLRHGLLLGAGTEPDHELAGEVFSRLLAESPPSDAVELSELRELVMLSRYRAHQLEGAFEAAATLLDPPTKRVRNTKRLGMLAILGGSSRGQSSSARRIAADCVERLGDHADLEPLPSKVRSEVLGELALRALFRRDLVLTKELADRALGGGEVPEGCGAFRAMKALATVADLEGDEARAAKLRTASTKVRGRHRGGGSSFGMLGALSGPSWASELAARAYSVEEEAEDSVAFRRIQALSRLCLEPDHWQVPLLRDGDVSLTVVARAFDHGAAEVEVSWQPWEVLPAITECFEQMGSVYFSGAPRSAMARIDLSRVTSTPSAVRMRETMEDSEDRFGILGSGGGFGGLGSRGGGGLGGGGGGGGLGKIRRRPIRDDDED